MCCIGGENRKKEKSRLRGGIGILLATPGRLADHLSSTSSLRLLPLLFLLIDEADRLLDLGFEAKVRGIYTACVHRIKEETDIAALQQQARDEWRQQQQQQQQQQKGDSEAGRDSDDDEQQQLREIRQQERMHSSNSSSSSSSSEVPFQVAMASATLTPSVQRLAAFCLRKDPQWLSLSLAETAETRMAEVQQLLQRKQQKQQQQQQQQQQELREEEPLSEGLEAKILKRLCCCSMPAAAAAVSSSSSSSSSSGDQQPMFDVPSQLQQYYLVVEPRLRLLPLLSFLLSAEARNRKLVVFVSSCALVDYLYQLLLRLKWPLMLEHNRQLRQRMLQQQQLMRKLQVQQHEQQQHLGRIAAGIKQQRRRGISRPQTAAAAAAAEEEEEEMDEERDELADDDLGEEAPGLWGDFLLRSLNVFRLHGNMTRDDR